jgi:SAM-dependent methyltransferase
LAAGTFDELISEAVSAPFSGWDFSWLAARSTPGSLPWSYSRELARRAQAARSMLDMGTGGGERLARLSPRPRMTVATESWPPNVPVAAARLRPLGIPVVQDEGAPENMDQDSARLDGARQDGAERGRLPFSDGTFALVANRHESFLAAEVRRVLSPGGTFITQQVDFHSDDALYRLLGLEVPQQPDSWLPLARQQVQDAGLTVQAAVRGEECHDLQDVGAVVYYLRIVSWAIPQFTLDAYLDQLRAAHETPELWPVRLRQRRFLLIAAKPPRRPH